MSKINNMAKKYGFDFDVSNLTEWNEEKAGEMAVRQVSEARTLDLIEIIPDVKGTESRPILSTEIIYQDGTGCATTAAGDDVIEQYEISTVKLKIEKSYCVDDLAPFFTRQYLAAGANAEDQTLPFADQLTSEWMKNHALQLDKLIWQGDTSLSGTNNLKWFDGFATKFDASVDVLEANDLGTTTLNAGNIYAALERVYTYTAEQNAALVDNPNWTIFVNRNLFTMLKSYYAAENNFHLDPQNKGVTSITLFGFDVNIECIPGLIGKNSIYAGIRTEFKFATDLVNDISTFKIWYSEDDDAIKVRSKFRAGVAVPFYNQITKFTPDGSAS
jgi:hypothetical protein